MCNVQIIEGKINMYIDVINNRLTKEGWVKNTFIAYNAYMIGCEHKL